MASFVLRGVDTALWTAARQACKAEGVQLVTLIETYLSRWLSDESTRQMSAEIRARWQALQPLLDAEELERQKLVRLYEGEQWPESVRKARQEKS